MTGLGDMAHGLARLRKTKQGRGQGGDAGMTEVRGIGFNPGGLRALAYTPKGLEAGAGLVVVLHGCTQRAGPHARAAGWLTLADRYGFAVLAPEQDPGNNPNRCFNWFEPGDTARARGEAASIHAMVEHMIGLHDLDPGRVFITGLSAGGAMTAVLLATYPEVFAGGAVVAGLPYGVAGNVQQALTAMRSASRMGREDLAALVTEAAPEPERWPRLTIWHGQADATVSTPNAHVLAQQWAAVHGADRQPSQVERRGGRIRSTWRNAQGEVVVECNILAGVGHGTPLAAGGEDPIGEVAPFMLETGVSAAHEITRFWGLAPAEAASSGQAWSASASRAEPEAAAAGGLGAAVMASVSPHLSKDIQDVISKALTSAGLMR